MVIDNAPAGPLNHSDAYGVRGRKSIRVDALSVDATLLALQDHPALSKRARSSFLQVGAHVHSSQSLCPLNRAPTLHGRGCLFLD